MDSPEVVSPKLARWSWALLWLTVGVIVGGSLVRATGSGDGCGDSWPRCQGSLFPLGGGTETTIEFAHRAATAMLGIVLVAFVVAAFRAGPAGKELRRAFVWVGGFFLGEVAIGAVLVLFEWVDQDASLGRVIVVPLHLINTFFLVSAVVLVVHIANGGIWPRFNWARQSNRYGLMVLGLLLLVGASGALNALADTLYPPDSVLDGIRQEFGPTAPFLVRLRVLHPFLANIGGVGAVMALRSAAFDGAGRVRKLANGLPWWSHSKR
ncbi:MAG: heme A synthase [Acidimicrobiia bacterium]|nr:heme A synthase [Acidimicrobiia bacterium]